MCARSPTLLIAQESYFSSSVTSSNIFCFLFNCEFSFQFVWVRRMRTLLFVDAARLLDSSKLILKRSAAETKTNLWDSQTTRRRRRRQRQRCVVHAEHQQTKTSFFLFATKNKNNKQHNPRIEGGWRESETGIATKRSHCAVIVGQRVCEQCSTHSTSCSLLSLSAHACVRVCAFVWAAAAKRTNRCA